LEAETGNLGDRKASNWWQDLSKLGASVNRQNWFFNNIMWELGELRLVCGMIFGLAI